MTKFLKQMFLGLLITSGAIVVGFVLFYIADKFMEFTICLLILLLAYLAGVLAYDFLS